MKMKFLIWILLDMFMMTAEVKGHGRLIEPPSRSSMWRYGYSTPVNYNDNNLNCGAYSQEWMLNQRRCGVCGDPYDGPRINEAGGKYATGTITRRYTEGQTIQVKVAITSAHRGYFEFRLCPHNNTRTPVSQDCLDKYLLRQPNGDTRLNGINENKEYSVDLVLPNGVTCWQCVLQWKYNAGNSYGCDGSHCCIGCGIQEQFYGCSDVSIVLHGL